MGQYKDNPPPHYQSYYGGSPDVQQHYDASEGYGHGPVYAHVGSKPANTPLSPQEMPGNPAVDAQELPEDNSRSELATGERETDGARVLK